MKRRGATRMIITQSTRMVHYALARPYGCLVALRQPSWKDEERAVLPRNVWITTYDGDRSHTARLQTGGSVNKSRCLS